MKQLCILVGAVISLSLVSFTNFQDGKVQKDKNGNYIIKNLKVEKKVLLRLVEMTELEESSQEWNTSKVVNETVVKKVINTTIWKNTKKDPEGSPDPKDDEKKKEEIDKIMSSFL